MANAKHKTDSVTNNNVTRMPIDTPSPNIGVFDPNGLQLEAVPPATLATRGLSYLMLDDNRLSSLPAAIGGLAELRWLSLAKTDLWSRPRPRSG